MQSPLTIMQLSEEMLATEGADWKRSFRNSIMLMTFLLSMDGLDRSVGSLGWFLTAL